MKRCIGDYASLVVSKSLCMEDGLPLTCKDQSNIMNFIENLKNFSIQISGDAPYNFAIITYGIAAVYEILKT